MTSKYVAQDAIRHIQTPMFVDLKKRQGINPSLLYVRFHDKEQA